MEGSIKQMGTIQYDIMYATEGAENQGCTSAWYYRGGNLRFKL